MFIDVDNRQAGKTTRLIRDAHFTGFPIIVPNVGRREFVLDQAKNMCIEVQCYTVSELKESKGINVRGRGVLVDELDDVLSVALGGATVIKATMSRNGVI